MFNSKLTTKLLFVSLFLLPAGPAPAQMAGEKAIAEGCLNCRALDNACEAAGATPGPCVDEGASAAHTCALDLNNPEINPVPYVAECHAQGGEIIGTSAAIGGCVKTCP